MPINVYKIKKWSAGFLMAFLPTLTFLVMIISADFIQALVSFFIMVPLSTFIGFKLIHHPLIDYLEGKGLLVWTIDSTGAIETFIVNVASPFLEGTFRKKRIETIFNRETMNYMSHPTKITGHVQASAKNPDIQELTLKIPKKDKNSIQFGFGHFPVLIYNKNLETFISKDAFANFEKDTFIRHMVLYLNRKVEDLTSQLRDFARYIVEQTRPKASIWGAGWVKWMLLFIGIFAVAILLGPYIIGTFSNMATAEGATDIISPLG
jgi:hypothetical protein